MTGAPVTGRNEWAAQVAPHRAGWGSETRFPGGGACGHGTVNQGGTARAFSRPWSGGIPPDAGMGEGSFSCAALAPARRFGGTRAARPPQAACALRGRGAAGRRRFRRRRAGRGRLGRCRPRRRRHFRRQRGDRCGFGALAGRPRAPPSGNAVRRAARRRRKTEDDGRRRKTGRDRRHGYRGGSGGAARADAGRHRAGGRHRRARAGARGRAGQVRHAHGLPAQHGAGAQGGARPGGQDRERGARGGGGGACRAQGGARGRRAGRRHRRGRRGRDAAGSRAADRHAPPHQRHHRRDIRDLPGPGLLGGAGPRGGDVLLQLRGAERPGRPPQPRSGRHVLRGGPLRRRVQRARRVRRAAAHADLRRAGARDGGPEAAHLRDRARQGVPPRRGRPLPPAAVPPDRGPGGGSRASRSAT